MIPDLLLVGYQKRLANGFNILSQKDMSSFKGMESLDIVARSGTGPFFVLGNRPVFFKRFALKKAPIFSFFRGRKRHLWMGVAQTLKTNWAIIYWALMKGTLLTFTESNVIGFRQGPIYELEGLIQWNFHLLHQNWSFFLATVGYQHAIRWYPLFVQAR